VQTYRASGEHWLDVFHENGPPLLQQLGAVRGNVARCLHVPRFRVENCLPRLNGTDEVHDLGVLSKPSRSQQQQRSLTFYIPFKTKHVISEVFFPANASAHIEQLLHWPLFQNNLGELVPER